MREFSDITGRRVYFTGEGKEGGVVKDVLIDTKDFRIAGFVVRDTAEEYLPYEKVNHMEGDSVTAGGEPDIESLPKENYLKGSSLKGLKVVTENGNMLGNAATFYFEPSGRITHYEVSGGVFKDITEGHRLLPGAGVKVIGPDAIIVNNEVEEIIKDMKRGGGGAADAASRLAESFKEMMRNFGPKKGAPGNSGAEMNPENPGEKAGGTKKDEIEGKIKEKEKEIKEKAEKKGGKYAERAKDRAEEAAKEGELKAEKTKRKIEEKTEDIKDKIKDTAEEADKNIRKKMDDIEKK